MSTRRNPAVMPDPDGYAKGRGLAIGEPGARPWKVGVRDPRGAGSAARLVSSSAMAAAESVFFCGNILQSLAKPATE